METKQRIKGRTVEGRVTAVLAPTDTTGSVEVLLNKVAALLEVVDTFDAVTPLKLLSQDLGFLYVNPLLPHLILSHIEIHHRILVRILRIVPVRRRFIELHGSLLSPHFSSPPSALATHSSPNSIYKGLVWARGIDYGPRPSHD